MFITRKNYKEALHVEEEKNKIWSEKVMKLLDDLKIRHLNFVSVGNSLASGYSKCDEMTPFFMRSHLYKLSKNIDYYSFARIRHNRDIQIASWYQNNVSHEEINHLLIDDIERKKDTYSSLWTIEEVVHKYHQFLKNETVGLRDIFCAPKTIMVYNGFTGSFTDIFRNGSYHDYTKIPQCFMNDIAYGTMLLKQMAMDSPYTQIYVYGLPNLMNTGIISLYNRRIKRVCDDIPSAIFVPGTVRSCLFTLEGQKQRLDVHYNKAEYLRVINHFLERFYHSYVPTLLTTELLTALKTYNHLVECENTISKGNIDEINQIIDNLFEKYRPLFEISGGNMQMVLNEIANFYTKHYLEEYYCTMRDETREKILRKY